MDPSRAMAACAGGSVDWLFLRQELEAWSAGPSDAPIRWMTLCIFSNWIARITQVWEGCLVGVVTAVLHASFCSEPGPARLQLFQQAIHDVSLQGWPGLALDNDWPVFELIAAHARVLKSGIWSGQEELFAEDPPSCTDVAGSGERAAAALEVLEVARTAAEGEGQGANLKPRSIQALNLLCAAPLVHDFASSTACVIKSLFAPFDRRGYLLTVAEDAATACLGQASMLAALLRTRWPLAALLGRFRRKESSDAEVRGLEFLPAAIKAEAAVFQQQADVTFPWVRFVARAVPAQRIYTELPWPQLSFQEIRREALELLERFAVTNYPGPSNDRGTWKTLCLVCKDGTQDPTTTEARTFAKTEALSFAPVLERFIDLFGKTGRVRLSVVLPDGMIAWHPDDGLLDSGRLILHVPIQSNRRALTRLGHLLLQVPEGVLHWADYSMPHSVFNGGSEPRVHLIIDVAARGNEDFERNVLRRMEPSSRAELLRNALPEGGNSPAGTAFARPLARQMSDTFATLLSEDLAPLERSIWQQVAFAFGDQVRA
ncbi:unnamed protein product [Effrenium voratum]|nr:unnamed protein product [Effrenium voratum]